MDFRIISIGALSAHPLWGEKSPARPGHATTTLITSGDARIIVDPGLSPAALGPRLLERANLRPRDITHVFLTRFAPEVRRGITLFENAEWLIHETEREAVGVPIAAALRDMASRDDGPGDDSLRDTLQEEIAILSRCKPAPDSTAERVDLFPLPGISPGTCGLLLEGTRATTLVCGDAVPTWEHLSEGKILQSAADVDAARASLEEAIEIADLLVLGRDNLAVNPTKRPF